MHLFVFANRNTLSLNQNLINLITYVCGSVWVGGIRKAVYTFHTWNNINALYMQKVNLNQHEQEKQTHLYFT